MFPLKYPKTNISIQLLLLYVLVLPLANFETTSNPRAVFSPADTTFKKFEDFEAKYGTKDLLIFIVQAKNENLLDRHGLAALTYLSDKAWSLPKSLSVDSIIDYNYTQVDGDTIFTEPLFSGFDQLSDDELNKRRAYALNETELVNNLVSKKGHVAAVSVLVKLENRKEDAIFISSQARDLVERFQANYPDYNIYLAGPVAFADAMTRASEEALGKILPLGALVAFLVLGIVFRSFALTLFSLLVIIASSIAAMGVGTAVGIVFQPLSSYAPAIILTVGLADSVHIILGLNGGTQKKEWTKQEIVHRSVKQNYQPILLTSLTTAVGFLFLLQSESPPIQDLGVVVAIGVLFAFYFSLVLLPSLLVLLPKKTLLYEHSTARATLVRLSYWVYQNKSKLLAINITLVIGLVFFSGQNRINDVWIEYFKEGHDIREAYEFMGAELTGLHRFYFSMPAGDIGGISNPEYLQELNKFRHWLLQQEEVETVNTFSDMIKKINRQMHSGEDEFYDLPNNAPLISQYLLLYELSLPAGKGIENTMTMDRDESFFSVVVKQSSSKTIAEVVQRTENWMSENLPSYMQAEATGLDIMFARVAIDNSRAMLIGTFQALIVISLLLILGLRSLKLGIISFIPNLVPILVAFGVWGLIDANVGLSTSIVACLTMGIIVDDTVHLITKYQRLRTEGCKVQQALEISFSQVGLAIIITSVVLILNFGIFVFSSFYPSSSLGVLTSITILAALLVDLFLFVPVLLMLEKKEPGIKTLNQTNY